MSSRGLSVDAAVPVTGIHAAAMAWRYRGEIRVSAIAKATFAFADDATMPLVAPAAIAPPRFTIATSRCAASASPAPSGAHFEFGT